MVEKHVDLSAFDARSNNDETGASAIHPKILLKIILLAYARGMLSSRKMERACLENVTFMALACGYTPDHSTIAAFISSMQEEVKTVFCNVLLLCDQLGLLGGSHFSLDGVKRADPCDQREGKRSEHIIWLSRRRDWARRRYALLLWHIRLISRDVVRSGYQSGPTIQYPRAHCCRRDATGRLPLSQQLRPE